MNSWTKSIRGVICHPSMLKRSLRKVLIAMQVLWIDPTFLHISGTRHSRAHRQLVEPFLDGQI